MKKAISVILIAALLCIAAFALFGCNAAAGDYTFESATILGITFTRETAGEGAVTLKLNNDGTYIFRFQISTFSVSESGTWAKDGSAITFTDQNGGGSTATFEGNKLTWDYGSGRSFVFSK